MHHRDRRPAGQNHPVAASFLKQASKRGAKLIVMDPRKQGLSRHATWHLQFKPGQDVALLNAMLHTIIEEELTTGSTSRPTPRASKT